MLGAWTTQGRCDRRCGEWRDPAPAHGDLRMGDVEGSRTLHEDRAAQEDGRRCDDIACKVKGRTEVSHFAPQEQEVRKLMANYAGISKGRRASWTTRPSTTTAGACRSMRRSTRAGRRRPLPIAGLPAPSSTSPMARASATATICILPATGKLPRGLHPRRLLAARGPRGLRVPGAGAQRAWAGGRPAVVFAVSGRVGDGHRQRAALVPRRALEEDWQASPRGRPLRRWAPDGGDAGDRLEQKPPVCRRT